jgi:HPt (histidine-containing phosphotransfer) domain-containing protein
MTDSISNNNELPRFNLKEFRCITENDVELQIDAIETYIRSSAQEMNKLKVALAQSQKKDAEIIAHSIKGASKYVAADKVSLL